MTKTIVWSKNGCLYCEWAKRMLKSKDIPFEERNISTGEWTREQMQEAAPGSATFPQIFMHGTYVGGYTDLQQYFEDCGMFIN